MIYLELFLSFLQIGAFSFGGGYAAMPLIQQQVVNTHHWISLNEFSDLITISQMTPGPIAINSATFVGTRVAGMGGAVVATIGCVLPSCLLVSILAYLYYRYKTLSMVQGVLRSLRPAVIALIAGAGLSILLTAFWPDNLTWENLPDIRWHAVLLFALSWLLLRWKKMSPILVMVLSGGLEVALTACERYLPDLLFS